MKIYSDRQEYKDFKCLLIKHDSHYLSYLFGINLSQQAVEPVYRALLLINKCPGMLSFEFPWFIMLFRRRTPYFYIERIKGVRFE